MLKSRLEAPRAVARASHAIRSQTSEEHWLRIDSTNVDEIVNSPLPSVDRQITNLINWTKEQVGDAHLSNCPLPSNNVLSAIVGAPDEDAVDHLLSWASEKKLLIINGRNAHLTPEAWEKLPEQTASAQRQSMPKKNTEKGHCPNCGPNRNANVMASHDEKWEDGPIWTVDTYMILKCAGCDTIFIKRSHLFSENEEYDTDPVTGEFDSYIEPTVSYWPAPAKRARPDWLEELNDGVLISLLEEVYSALDNDDRVLAAIGTRTILDRAIVLLGADAADDFGRKLNWLNSQGFIGAKEKDTLLALTDAGGAAAHRGWRPEPEQLLTILDGLESFLHRTFVLGKALERIRSAVPPRPERKRPESYGDKD